MKSPPGAGLQCVKEQIEAAFQAARTDGSPNRSEIQTVEPQKPLRPLAERAAAYLKAAERHLPHEEERKHCRGTVHHIVVPTESAEQLLKMLGGE